MAGERLLVENRIFSNGGLGIDVGGDGVTTNDSTGGNYGSDGLLDFPVLIAAVAAGSVTTASGTVDIPAGGFQMEFFVSDSCDPSGNGEGRMLVYSQVGLSPGGIGLAFDIPLPGGFAGQYLTATTSMTMAPWQTSEFSNCIPVTP